AIAVSMCLGRLLEGIIPGEQIHLFGESMLVCLGVFFLVRSIMELRKERVEKLCTDETDSACVSETPLFQWRVPGLDVMIKIMNNPQHADLDHSGQINSKEAVWLGFALAMDSFGAGVCIALMGFSVLWVSICTLSFAFLLVSTGYIWGGYAGEVPQYRKLNLLPGIMLITLGMIRILFI
ncbi:MAG: manganese efflux pump, partial [Peptococcaceae bacterium]|nr:manganese efflux pump [Peptococcaceae bacterium]